MKSYFSTAYISLKENIINNIKKFNSEGKSVYKGKRNELKVFETDELKYCIKSFKKPHLLNKFIYKYIRKSKAKRSFEYANKFIECGINTPKPIAYLEASDAIGIKESYYVCEFLEFNLRYKELLLLDDLQKKETILRQFTRFTYSLQQNNIEFIDHSPGNTLILDNGNEEYSFYLVDLNRTNFNKKMDFNDRMKNFSKLTIDKNVVKIMSNEYAKVSGESETAIFNAMWDFTEKFQKKFQGKKKLKKKLKFWKK